MSQNDTQDLDQYTLTNRREIIFYLNELINHHERVSVSFNEGRDVLLTLLLEVDDASNTLIFDVGGSKESNKRLLQSQRNYFIANPQGVRNQFFCGPVRETTWRNRLAFATNLPDRYVRLQRREFFRLMLPITRRPVCIFKGGRPLRDWKMDVVDIGIGGVGLESAQADLPFSYRDLLVRAAIDLAPFGVLQTDLEVCHVDQVTRGGKLAGRLGCHFTRLTSGQEMMLQKFITQIQREEKARLGL